MAEFILKKAKETDDCGADRMFGSPNVCDDFVWPTATDKYGNESDMMFLCQVSCSSIESEYLPNDGILYFFYDALNCPSTPNIKDGAKVILYTGDRSSLSQMRLVDENGNDVSPDAYMMLPAEQGIVSILPPDDEEFEDEELYGEYEGEYGDEESDAMSPDDDSIVLAAFSEFEDENVSFNFENGTCLYFLVSRKAFENGDLSDIRVFVA